MRRICTLLDRLKMDCEKRGITSYDLFLYILIVVLLMANISIFWPKPGAAEGEVVSKYGYNYGVGKNGDKSRWSSSPKSVGEFKAPKTRSSVDLRSVVGLEPSNSNDYSEDSWGDSADTWEMEYNSNWYESYSSDSFPNACFFEMAARFCNASASETEGSFCQWFSGCHNIKATCKKNFYRKCEMKKTKLGKEGNDTLSNDEDPCCKCGRKKAIKLFREPNDIEEICPMGYPPDTVSLLDTIGLVFQREVHGALKKCDLDKSGCIDSEEELIRVASLRTAGPLQLKTPDLSEGIQRILKQIFRSRDTVSKSSVKSLRSLDTNNDGCLTREETLLHDIQLGKCYIPFAGEGRGWEKDFLPTSISEKFSVSIGIYPRLHCEYILGASWKAFDKMVQEAPQLKCIAPEAVASVKPIEVALEALLKAVKLGIHDSKVSQVGTEEDAPEQHSILTYDQLSSFHMNLTKAYEIQDLSPQFRLPSPFNDAETCVYEREARSKNSKIGISSTKMKAAGPSHKMNLTIPRIVHQSWKSRNSIPDFALGWLASWPIKNPDYKYIFWDDNDNDEFIRKRFPHFLMAYRGMKPVEKADFARYGYLYEFGGVYADMDTECVQNMDALRNKAAYIGQEPIFHAVLLEHRRNQFASNALMASVQRHPFWLFLMTGIVIGDGSGDPVTKTGPRRISLVHDNFFLNGTGGRHGMVDIMPEEYFMPQPAWWNIDAMMKACEEAEEEKDEYVLGVCERLLKESKRKDHKSAVWGENTFSVHNWRCTWCRGTGTEIFQNITDHPKLKEHCLKPSIEVTTEKWLKCDDS